MKIKIGPYLDFWGPYQIAEKILFWIPKYDGKYEYTEAYEKYVHGLGEWMAGKHHDTWFYNVCQWIHSKRKRTIKIHIDRWDSWNTDSSIAMIALPMLKQLRDTKHGSPFVDLEDVPEELRYVETEEHDSQACFDFYHADGIEKKDCDVHTRWAWVLDEMIWAFEMHLDDDAEDQFSTGESDWFHEPCKWDDNGKVMAYEMKEGPGHTRKTDWEGLKQFHVRKQNGFRLFGKYFTGLWD